MTSSTTILIALDNSGAWVGLTALKKTDDHCHIAFTGVVAEHRGQGVALALKLAAIDLMQQAGVREVTTVNHAANGPMLAVNRKLGYRPLPGHYQMHRSEGGSLLAP